MRNSTRMMIGTKPTCTPNSVFRPEGREAVICLGSGSLHSSSGLPGVRVAWLATRGAILDPTPYLALLRVGFALPPPLPEMR